MGIYLSSLAFFYKYAVDRVSTKAKPKMLSNMDVR